MPDWVALALTTLVGALALRFAPEGEGSHSAAIDVGIAGLVFAFAYFIFRGVVNTWNPDWVPWGQDNHDFLACIVSLRRWDLPLYATPRYPLYAGLVAALSGMTGTGLARMSMEVSLGTSALLPASAYVFGRVFAPRPVALVGALLTMSLRTHLVMIGTPTDYPLAAALYALASASMVVALRDGTVLKHGLAGLALAAFFASTPKAFPFLLLAFIAMGLRHLLNRRIDMRSMGAFVAPVAGAWLVFAAMDLPLSTLEENILTVHLNEHYIDTTVPFPDVGWKPTDAKRLGYWIPGTADALRHLPDVVRYLAFTPLPPMTVSERIGTFLPRLAREMSMTGLEWMVPAGLLGVLGAMRKGTGALGNAAAVAFAFLNAGVLFWGLGSAPYADRYGLPNMVTTPALVLALFALPARGRGGMWIYAAWTPLFVAAAWVLGPSGGSLGFKQFAFAVERPPDPQEPLAAVAKLLKLAEPGDAVVDASNSQVVPSILDGVPVVVEKATMAPLGSSHELSFGASGAPHRYVVLDCVNTPSDVPDDYYHDIRGVLASQIARFPPVARCVYRDLRPDLPFAAAL